MSGYMLAGTGAPSDDDDEPAPKQVRRHRLRKNTSAPRPREPMPAVRGNGRALAAVDGTDGGVIAVLEDGSVAVFAGDSVAHMLETRLVRRIVDLVQRLSVKP